MVWLLSTLAAIAPVAVWALRSYMLRMNQAAVEQERQAGRDAQQNEAIQNEIARNQRAADAGDAAAGVPNDWLKDPDNRARK